MKITHSYSDITNWFFETLTSILEKQGNATVGLAGGSSFDQFYTEILQHGTLSIDPFSVVDESQNELLRRMKHGTLLTRACWCVTDERVNCDISDRNDAHIWDVFLGPLFAKYSIPEGNFIRPMMDSDGAEYSERVGNIDIAFFGMGPDGHTASLFPHHPTLESEEEGFIQIDNAPKPPPERISLSPRSIQSLTHVCLFAVGESKKEALANFLDETMSINDCPVKLLKPDILLDLTR